MASSMAGKISWPTVSHSSGADMNQYSSRRRKGKGLARLDFLSNRASEPRTFVRACVLECGGHEAAFGGTFYSLPLAGKHSYHQNQTMASPFPSGRGQR